VKLLKGKRLESVWWPLSHSVVFSADAFSGLGKLASVSYVRRRALGKWLFLFGGVL
jgi:hypothetical protein